MIIPLHSGAFHDAVETKHAAQLVRKSTVNATAIGHEMTGLELPLWCTCRESVLARPPEVFYRNQMLKPYMFFDVAGGRDVISGTGGSRRNQAEADLAVALFQVLREELLAAMQRNELKAPVVVGVITPYREQVACIQATLRSVLGPQLAAEVSLLPPSSGTLKLKTCAV